MLVFLYMSSPIILDVISHWGAATNNTITSYRVHPNTFPLDCCCVVVCRHGIYPYSSENCFNIKISYYVWVVAWYKWVSETILFLSWGSLCWSEAIFILKCPSGQLLWYLCNLVRKKFEVYWLINQTITTNKTSIRSGRIYSRTD